MEDLECIFCKKSSDRIVIEENGYKGRKCPQCGLIFISPRPSIEEIENLYIHDQADVSAKSHILGSFEKRLHARHNLRIIKKFIKRGSMLEIGAGAGYFLDEARKKGFEVFGIELNDIQADFIRSKLEIPCEETPINASSFGQNKYDVIYHCNVMSHFYNPILEFEKINGKLKKNGFVVFETVNFGDVKGKYYGLIGKFQYPEHLFFFSESNFKKLLRLTGFEVIKIYKFSIQPQLIIGKISRRIVAFFKSKARIKEVKKDHIVNVPSSNSSNSGKFSFKEIIINIESYFMFLIRYKIGYIMPKKHRPQTVIVIARKSKAENT